MGGTWKKATTAEKKRKKEKDPERRWREGIRKRDDSLWKSKIKWWGNVRGAMSAQLLL